MTAEPSVQRCHDCGELVTVGNLVIVARNGEGELVLWRGGQGAGGYIWLCEKCDATRMVDEEST